MDLAIFQDVPYKIDSDCSFCMQCWPSLILNQNYKKQKQKKTTTTKKTNKQTIHINLVKKNKRNTHEVLYGVGSRPAL